MKSIIFIEVEHVKFLLPRSGDALHHENWISLLVFCSTNLALTIYYPH